MNITLSYYQAHLLAEQFADVIYGRVIQMHLWRIGTTAKGPNSELAEVMACIRSVPPGLDRINFVSAIRFHFKRIRETRGGQPRWQQYVAAVEAHRAQAA